MNLDLHSKNVVLTTLTDVIDGYVVDQQFRQNISIYGLPSLQQVLRRIGPLPKDALFLGLAEDGLPVLLNLWNPAPGPVLIAGDSHAGKTGLLQTIGRFAVATHDAREIQYGVITNHPQQWFDDAAYSHCIGVFSTGQNDATNFIRALAAWIELHQDPGQSILLLIDGLDDFPFWNGELVSNLQKILSHGAAKRIWTFATVNMEDIQTPEYLLEYFHTRVFGYTKHVNAIDHDCPYFELENLTRGAEFCWKEKQQWLKVRIPGI
jgi:hypothetical protein